MLNAVLLDTLNAPVTRSFETSFACIEYLSSCEGNCIARIEKDGANEVLSVRSEQGGNLFYRYDGSCWRQLSAEQISSIFEHPARGRLLQILEKIHTMQKEPDLELSVMPCPRCGRLSMDSKPIRNALSRHATVYVCNACGMDEAMRDYAQTVLPLEKWAFAKLAGKQC